MQGVSVPSAAEALMHFRALIAALNRCATLNPRFSPAC